MKVNDQYRRAINGNKDDKLRLKNEAEFLADTFLKRLKVNHDKALTSSKPVYISERLMAHYLSEVDSVSLLSRVVSSVLPSSSSRLQAVDGMLVSMSRKGADDTCAASVLTSIQLAALRKMVWHDGDDSASHRAQTKIKSLIECGSIKRYVKAIYEIYQTGHIERAHRLIKDHLNDLDYLRRIVAQLKISGYTDLLLSLLSEKDLPNLVEMCVDELVGAYLENPSDVDLLYQTSELCPNYNKDISKALKINFYQNPESERARKAYTNHLLFGKSAVLSDHEEEDAWSILKISFENGDLLSGYQLAVFTFTIPVFYQSKEAFKLLLFIVENSTVEYIKKIAFELLEKSFHHVQNDVDLVAAYADVFRYGIGCNKSEMKANELYLHAARLGSVRAFQFCFGSDLSNSELLALAKKDFSAAVSVLKNKNDDPDAKTFLSLCYHHGYGVERRVLDEEKTTHRETVVSVDDHYLDKYAVANRDRVRFFNGVGYDYLINQTKSVLMRLGVHRINFYVAPQVGAVSKSYYSSQSVADVLHYSAEFSGDDRVESALLDLSWCKGIFETGGRSNKKSVAEVLKYLNNGGVLLLERGWSTHAVCLAFFKVGGDYYFGYANKGATDFKESGIRVYRIGDKDKFTSPEFLKKILENDSLRDYIEDHKEHGKGIGNELKLENVLFVERSSQNGGNCTHVASHSAILLSMLARRFREKTDGVKLSVNGCELFFQKCYDEIFEAHYKPWRFHLRVEALRSLCDLGDCRKRVYISAEQHLDILQKVVDRLASKYYGKEDGINTNCSTLLQVIDDYIKSPSCGYTKEQRSALSEHIIAALPEYGEKIKAQPKARFLCR